MEMFSLIATIKKLGQQSSLLLLSKCTKSLIKIGVNNFLFPKEFLDSWSKFLGLDTYY